MKYIFKYLAIFIILFFTFHCKRVNKSTSATKEAGFISPGHPEFALWQKHFSTKFQHEQFQKSIFHIWNIKANNRYRGVAFLISQDGYLLTARHTIEDCLTKPLKLPIDCSSDLLKLWIKTGRMTPARWWRSSRPIEDRYNFQVIKVGSYKSPDGKKVHDDDLDVALLKIDKSLVNTKPLQLSSTLPNVPLRVFTIGTPLPKYPENQLKSMENRFYYPIDTKNRRGLSYSTGSINVITPEKNLLSAYNMYSEYAIDVFYGNSGSPIFLENGLITGIHFSDKKFKTAPKESRPPSYYVRNVSSYRVIKEFELTKYPSILEQIK